MSNCPSGKERTPDLTGRTFGRLTVLGPAGKIGGALAWRCRCGCGNETVVKGYNLTSGHTRSCGCLRDDTGKAKTPDLTGRTFGRLTVLGPAGKIGGALAFRCRCGCGNETVAKGYDLTSGHTRSCGCLIRDVGRAKRLDLTGRTYGKLTVLGPAEDAGKDTAWLCRCECGNEIVARTRGLTSGTTRSCGCLRGRWERTRMDLTGGTYGRLTVLERAEDIDGVPAWLCRCDCGNETVVRQRDLRSGHTRSCGCGQGAARLDLTGDTYGRLTVLGPAEDVDGHTVWKCRCDCGNEVTVRTSGLRSGRTRSCGCLAREISRGRRVDLTGRKFGRLTVLGPAENMGRYTAWRCRCECGSEVTVRSNNLTAGKTQSCGCLARDASRAKRADLTGRKFGLLTVLEPAEKMGRYTAWRCRCECGNETVVRTHDLKSGATKGCGCLKTGKLSGQTASAGPGGEYGRPEGAAVPVRVSGPAT